MARTHGRILTSIWSKDRDFRSLEIGPQHLYLALVTSPRLSLCGTVDYMPDRIALIAEGLTSAKVQRTVAVLESRRYLVVDRETSELLVRSFVRHDGLLMSPNMAAGMAKAYHLIESEIIRRALIIELQRLYQEKPSMAGWSSTKVPGLKEVDPELFAQVMGEGFRQGFEEGAA